MSTSPHLTLAKSTSSETMVPTFGPRPLTCARPWAPATARPLASPPHPPGERVWGAQTSTVPQKWAPALLHDCPSVGLKYPELRYLTIPAWATACGGTKFECTISGQFSRARILTISFPRRYFNDKLLCAMTTKASDDHLQKPQLLAQFFRTYASSLGVCPFGPSVIFSEAHFHDWTASLHSVFGAVSTCPSASQTEGRITSEITQRARKQEAAED